MRKKIIHWNGYFILFILVNACSTFQYDRTENIIQTKWRLLSVRTNTNELFTNFQFDDCPVLTIGREEFEGFSDCNSFHGECKIDGTSIEFTNFRLTSKQCPQKMEIEKTVTTALRNIDNYSIDGRKLILKKGADVLMIYTKQ
jgi:heat shock protein HslJ